MGKSFVEASTEIDDLVLQKDQILTKIANTVASAIADRANNNKLNGLSKDVDNLLKDLSDAEKYQAEKKAEAPAAEPEATPETVPAAEEAKAE